MSNIMSLVTRRVVPTLLVFTVLALAHGDEAAMDMSSMDMGDSHNSNHTATPLVNADIPDSYFNYLEHKGTLYAHIAVMTLAWVVVVPLAVMLSLARSRYTILSQVIFGGLNTLGIFIAIGYNATTPDLYPNNAHHKLGWIVSVVVGTQIAIGIIGKLTGALWGTKDETHAYERVNFLAQEPVDMQHSPDHNSPYRTSDDTINGSPSSFSHSRSSSASTVAPHPNYELHTMRKERYGDEEDSFDSVNRIFLPGKSSRWTKISEKIAGFFSARVWRMFSLYYNVIDRVSLILGFITFCTGIVTLGRFFEANGIYSGLAHWIKGGIFLWLGILTLGRWSGSFGELGWAWNIRPTRKDQGWRPTAEFTESFMIFLYGITNIFMEHLGSLDGVWTHQDLEHFSITILFIGGGLCGMLIESTNIRDLLNTTVDESVQRPEDLAVDIERGDLQKPTQYSFSMNPIPALVILLLGIMMSSHQQHTMVSTMIHKQWGDLLAGASFARALTYIIMWLRPPASVYPSRPPTELLTSFGLIAGGIVFMASASNTVDAIIRAELDAMFLYTVTMGFVGLLMAWILILLAIKGWAIRREKRY